MTSRERRMRRRFWRMRLLMLVLSLPLLAVGIHFYGIYTNQSAAASQARLASRYTQHALAVMNGKIADLSVILSRNTADKATVGRNLSTTIQACELLGKTFESLQDISA